MYLATVPTNQQKRIQERIIISKDNVFPSDQEDQTILKMANKIKKRQGHFYDKQKGQVSALHELEYK